MSCYHPLKGIVIGTNAETGKKSIKVVKSDFTSPERDDTEYVQIPCGHCIGCFLDRSRQWADRCMLELQYHDKACFLTLTYDDNHLPEPYPFYDEDTGEQFSGFISPLVKKDLQKFVKDLRSRIVYKYKKEHPDASKEDLPRIRFFACGEYGEQTHRPHYHMILFGEDFSDDRTFYKFNALKQPLYNSAFLSSVWQHGYAVLADVSWNTCAYVSRYVTKKIKGSDNDFYDKYNIPPEFTVMSRRPGIGRSYYDDHKDKLYSQANIYVSDMNGSRPIRPCRYYDKLYDIDNPDEFSHIKEDRHKQMKDNQIMKSELTDLSYLDMLITEESNLYAKTKIFKRKEV